MLCGLKTILTDMNILNSYRHIRPKKVKYPIPEIPDDSGKKSGMDWVLPKIIGSGRVSGTRQALPLCFKLSLTPQENNHNGKSPQWGKATVRKTHTVGKPTMHYNGKSPPPPSAGRSSPPACFSCQRSERTENGSTHT